MTKNEFSIMIITQLEKNQQEWDEAKKRYDFARNYSSVTNPLYGEELKQTQYEMNLLNERRKLLRDLVYLPAYARIQAMPDIEIQEYKDQAMNTIILAIKQFRIIEKRERLKFEGLKNEKKLLISNLETYPEPEREKAIARVREINEKLINYSPNYELNIFKVLESELNLIQEQKIRLMEKSSQQIKDEKCSDLKNIYEIEEIVDIVSVNGITSSKRLYASVANDFEKAFEMANLIEQYSKLALKEQTLTSYDIVISNCLPKSLVDSLKNPTYSWDDNTSQIIVDVNNIDSVEKKVLEAEAKFKHEKERLSQEYTLDKLRAYCLPSSKELKINEEFMNMHSDKIEEEDIEDWAILDEQRKAFLKRNFILITKRQKQDLTDINTKILGVKSKMFISVERWYQTQCYNVIGANAIFQKAETWDSPTGRSSAQWDIVDFHEEMAITENELNKLKSNLQTAKIKIENETKEKQEKIANRIRELVGPEFEKEEIPVDREILSNDMSHIVEASTAVMQEDLVKKVQEEAQKQADNTEAKIRGITIEDLQRLKLLFKRTKEEMSVGQNTDQDTKLTETQKQITEIPLLEFEYIGRLEAPKKGPEEEPEDGRTL